MQEKLPELIFGVCMAAMLFSVGVYLTVKLRCVQLRRFLPAFRSLRPSEKNGVSAFSAACTNLGATVGMGNVLGVASGVTIGGAGSILWMLIAAFFGMAIRYAENALGAQTRKDAKQRCFGGPFFYMERYLPRTGKYLGRVFAILCVFGSLFGMGAALQASCIRTVWSQRIGDDPYSLCILTAVLLLFTAPVLLGGSLRIVKAAERIVPFMTLGYVICCIWILIRFRSALPSVVLDILRSGLSIRAAAGASFGIFFRRTVLTGVRRGLFSNEAGLGLGAIAAAAADSDAETAGEAGILVTFLDTFVICLLTGLCLLVTRQTEPLAAWRLGIPWAGEFAPLLLTLFLTLFALTSIFGSGFYAESCLRSLNGGERVLRAYRFAVLLCLAVGVFLPAEALWRSADLLNAALAIPNLLALFVAGKKRGIRFEKQI